MSSDEGGDDKARDKALDASQEKVSVLRDEAGANMDELTARSLDYSEKRKAGMRDKDTAEHLGSQPEIFDSSAPVAKADCPLNVVERDPKGHVSKVNYSEKDSATIKYDASGNISKVALSNEFVTWKREKGGWTSYDRDGKATEHRDSVQVSKDGDITFANKDGSSHTLHSDHSSLDKYADGHTVESDKYGRVTLITNKRGTMLIERDGDGEVDEIRGPGDSGWKEVDRDRWVHSTHGRPDGEVKGHVWVGRDGDVVIDGVQDRHPFTDGRHQEAVQYTIHPDGSETRLHCEGWRRLDSGSTARTPYGASTVEINALGRVTSIVNHEGKAETFKYQEPGGKLVEFTDANGHTFNKADHGWTERDAHGKFLGVKRQEFEMSPDGQLKCTRQADGGKITEERNPDGSRIEVYHRDGTSDSEDTVRIWDSHGRIEQAHYDDGLLRRFEYDGGGQLRSVKVFDRGGTRPVQGWELRSGSAWEFDYGNGKSTYFGRLTVNADGDFTEDSTEGRPRQVRAKVPGANDRSAKNTASNPFEHNY